LLRADSVTFSYRAQPGRVLAGISIEPRRGDIAGIIGPNGSGKTTLLKLLAGTLAPASGSVSLEGRPLSEWSRRQIAQKIAYVPQETHASFDFSVLDIVLMGRYPHLSTFSLEGPEDLAIARQALAATGASAFEQRPFGTLSGGEKQRVVIAGALAQSPQVMLLDEPTASLDIGHQLEIAALLARLNREQGVTMVLATHDLNFAASLCRQLVLLRDGRMLACGPTEQVLTTEAVRALYDVDADVGYHVRAGHLTVTPIARVSGNSR
jgi:iron complex transport system ATP-binding protein